MRGSVRRGTQAGGGTSGAHRTSAGLLGRRGVRARVGAGTAACAVGAGLVLGAGVSPVAAADETFQVLQMNLCNTGTDRPCHEDGRSIPEAMELIEELSPDVVTVNEVCERDVAELAEALGRTASYRFEPVLNGKNILNCTNGDPQGDAVLLAPEYPVAASTGGRFARESNTSMTRVYACVRTSSSAGAFSACVTHLALNNDTALAQCRELLEEVVPEFGAGRDTPAVVGGDFNLRAGTAKDVQGCVPDGYSRVGDNEVQHVMAAEDFALLGGDIIEMEYTDHPALLVRFRAPW